MNIEDIREYCLSRVGADESLPFGPDTLVFKVMGKAFLLTGLDAPVCSFNVKCDPERAVALREAYSCIRPGYHMNKRHWNTIECDGSLSDDFLRELIDHSYELVVAGLPLKIRKQLT